MIRPVVLMRISCAALALMAPAGCNMGPNPSRPVSVAGKAQSYVNAPAQPDAQPPDVTQWWRTFNDPVSNQLVVQALASNTDLRIAAARVMEAEALLGVAIGQRWPEVAGSIGRSRAQSTFDFSGDRFTSRATTWTMELDVAWQVDLFGKLRRGQEQAYLQALASQADRDAMLHTVISQVLLRRVQVATLHRLLELRRSDIASWERTYEVINRRYERGVTTALDLRLTQQNLAAGKAELPQIEFELAEARHALDVLLGQQPGTGELEPDTLTELPEFDVPPAGLPLWLLDRRPDLHGAELRAMAEQAGIGVALADLLPDITITAGGGYQASEFQDMFEHPESLIWSLIINASMKIFQGGALRANVDVARARAEAMAGEYYKQVLNAMREVEDSLVRERTARESYEYLKTAVAEAAEAERLSKERYERGVENLLTTLEAERRRRNTELAMVLMQRTVWSARINLFLALGGDWGVKTPSVKDYTDKPGAWPAQPDSPQTTGPGAPGLVPDAPWGSKNQK